MTKDERLKPVEAKNLIQTSSKFCEVFALKISFFPLYHKIVPHCPAVQVLLSFATPQIFIVLPISEHK